MAVVPAMDRREWDRVVELTKRAQDRGNDSLSWAIELSVELGSAGVALPSAELAHVLVSHVCWENNVPMAWKYLEKAVSMNVVPPMLVLALLSTRVVPSRRLSPAAYRLYLELLRRHIFSFFPKMNGPNYLKIFSSIDEALHLLQTFSMKVSQPGILVVGFVFAMVWQLLHATLDDEGLLSLTSDKAENWLSRSQDMETDGAEHFIDKINGSNDKLQKIDMQMAIELIAEFLQHKTTSRLLGLARNNMSLHFEEFLQRIELLAAKSMAIKKSSVSAAKLIRLSSSFVPRKLQLECKRDRGETHASFASRIIPSLPVHFYQACWSALWIPLDMFLEDCIDGSQIAASCAVEILSGLIKVLQAVNETTWQDTFLGAWLAALRLVQRERDPIEGPVPSQDTRLSILLSVTTQSIADIIEEEETIELNERDKSRKCPWKDISSAGQCRQGLISCLQVLGDYEGLLTPPQSVILAANQAVAKAVMFISGIPVESGYVDSVGINDNSVNCTGNMWHLIVEACIARNLIDTSAYIWRGYLSGRFNKLAHGMPVQGPSWSSLMKGAPLMVSMVNCLVATPASS